MGKLEPIENLGGVSRMKRFKKAAIVAAWISVAILALSLVSAASAVWGS